MAEQEVVEVVEETKVPAEPKENPQDDKKYTDAEVDAIIDKKFAKWKADHEKLLEEARSEGERLDRLTKDEREKEATKKREEALIQREKELAYKELRMETRTILTQEGLPDEFLDVVMADTADKIQENIKNLRSVFDKAVEQRVNERLSQKAPRNSSVGLGITREEIMNITDTAERQRLIAENKELFY
ncbi:DUF4355 domain-containing protein [Aerococcaceae bacterium zg-BR9]|uniref:DUF4355 domain-containing protein n=1 Tax=Aerococcaceae bacterium zg-1292 TaxID=2774330 RepID=UPI0040634509|nr:DUF4355 domain-containing protein [Aerococcaceae bacterium zg-BR9]